MVENRLIRSLPGGMFTLMRHNYPLGGLEQLQYSLDSSSWVSRLAAYHVLQLLYINRQRQSGHTYFIVTLRNKEEVYTEGGVGTNRH